MLNEIKIRVTADKPVFGPARTAAKAYGDDLKAEFGHVGDDLETESDKIGNRIGEKLAKGTTDRLRGNKEHFRKAGEDSGGETGKGFLSSMIKDLRGNLDQGLKFIGPKIAAPMVAGVAAASPLIGAVLSAGIIGGVGIGVAGIGAIIASKNAEVQAAGAGLGKRLMEGLTADSSSFIQPLLRQIGKIGTAFEGERDRIRHIFEGASGFLDPLVDGTLAAVDDILRGVDSLVESAGPVIDQLGQTFADVGQSIGDGMELISGGSQDAAGALGDLTTVITLSLDASFALIRTLTDLYGVLKYISPQSEAVIDALGKQSDQQEGTGQSASQLSDYLKELRAKQAASADAAVAQTDALAGLSDEMAAQADPLFALIKSEETVAQKQRAYNDALKKHGPNSREARSAMADLGEAALRLQGKVGAAAGGFDGRLTPAMRTALRNAGLTAGQMDRLEGQLRAAKAAADNWEGTFRQTFITTEITRRYGPGSDNADRLKASGGTVGAAAGGGRSGLIMVGEEDRELVELPAGSRVLPASSTRRALAGAGPGAGAGGALPPIIVPLIVDGREIARAMVEPTRELVRTLGQGSVQRYFGQPGVAA